MPSLKLLYFFQQDINAPHLMSGALEPTYLSHSNARAQFLRKHLEEHESTEDPDMDRTALEDVSDKKAARKKRLGHRCLQK
jgi:hypothetical protein